MLKRPRCCARKLSPTLTLAPRPPSQRSFAPAPAPRPAQSLPFLFAMSTLFSRPPPTTRGCAGRRSRGRVYPEGYDGGGAHASDYIHTKAKYPMLLMPIKVLMALDRFPPHQDLLRKRQLVAFDPDIHRGKVIFISHQWLGHDDPDSTGIQLKTTQSVLGKLMRGDIPQGVESDWRGQLGSKENLVVSAKQWKHHLPSMFVWVDFCSMPQMSGGPFSMELIPQEIVRGEQFGSFLGSFDASREGFLGSGVLGSVSAPASPPSSENKDDTDGKDDSIHAVQQPTSSPDPGHCRGLERLQTGDGESKEGDAGRASIRGPFNESELLSSPLLRKRTKSFRTQDHRNTSCAELEGWELLVRHWLTEAVKSIPAYVERSTLMLCVVPPGKHEDRDGETCDLASWRQRGWCRLEYVREEGGGEV